MMKKFTLLFLFLCAGTAAFSTTVTITNTGFEFQPFSVTITLGDSVRFTVDNIHKPVEVSEQTWNANGKTPLPGGFNLPFGGGLVLPADLGVGTHWYVCDPHASNGMKGTIIVEDATATEDIQFPAKVSIYPNPSNGKFQLIMDNTELSKTFDLNIYDMEGKRVYIKSRSEMEIVNDIDLSSFQKGIYVLKLDDGRRFYSTRVILQ
ncbi:MAG TPA: T9SS type A sorting domain-containing protein [Saprospiraceae bacterium]|nr:T9SS type A sorting domain-containing protein [Saprospiraceae bacterium]